jgi:hypothetical protein
MCGWGTNPSCTDPAAVCADETAPIPTAGPTGVGETSITPPPPSPYPGVCQRGDENADPKVCDSWLEMNVPPVVYIGDTVTIDVYEHPGWSVGGSCEYAFNQLNLHTTNGGMYFNFNQDPVDSSIVSSNGTIGIGVADPNNHYFVNTQYLSTGVRRYRLTWDSSKLCHSFDSNSHVCALGPYTLTASYNGHSDSCNWNACCDGVVDENSAPSWSRSQLIHNITGSWTTNRTFELKNRPPPPPKSCAIESVVQSDPGSVTVRYSGIGNTIPGTELVRLWLEKTDGSVFNPVPGGNEGIYPAAPTPGTVNSIRGGTCDSTNGLTCYKTKTFTDLNRGDYFLHCDLPSNSVPTMCSGNPFCDYEKPQKPGGNACGGWVSCSNSDNASFTVANSPPVWTSLVVKNNAGTPVVAEAGNRNQICQSEFNNSRRVTFEVNVADADGSADIDMVQLRFKRTIDPLPTYTVYVERYDSGAYGSDASLVSATMANVGTTGVKATFTIDFDSTFTPQAIYDMVAYARDTYLPTPAETTTDTGRDLKIWDCNVPVAGTVYDRGAGNAVCATGVGFADSQKATSAMNFYSVWVNNVSDGGMVETNAINENTYNGVTMIWGKLFFIITNSDIKASSRTTRWIDLGAGSSVGTTSCGQQQLIDNNRVDPYTANPHLQIDFSAAQIQDPWWQAAGGGVMSKTGINSMIPPTCVGSCQPAVSINSATGVNGLVAAPGGASNSAGCAFGGGVCQYGIPNNWGYTHNIVGDNSGYNYFYNNYFAKTGLGYTISGNATMTQIKGDGIGGSGVVLVNGDVTIDTDNALATDKFLMVVASGKINIDQNVVQTEGVLVAGQGIGASGTNDAQLQINGVVYANGGNVSFTRGYTTPMDNNTKPGVLVTYRPDLVFSLPASLSKVMTSWSQGK